MIYLIQKNDKNEIWINATTHGAMLAGYYEIDNATHKNLILFANLHFNARATLSTSLLGFIHCAHFAVTNGDRYDRYIK